MNLLYNHSHTLLDYPHFTILFLSVNITVTKLTLLLSFIAITNDISFEDVP